MTAQDFSQLANIYGADIKRWPEEYRPMIGDLASTQFAHMRQVLAEEQLLDDLLNQETIEPLSQALVGRIMQQAPQAKISIWQRLKAWSAHHTLSRLSITGAGLAGIGLAGMVTGVMFVSVMSSHLIANEALNNDLTVIEIIDFGQDWR